MNVEDQSFENPMTILLIEDNPGHAELVMKSLKNHRIRNNIIHLDDGEKAMNYLLREPPYDDPVKTPPPDLILLDLRLPKIDGLEVLRNVKDSPDLKHIPVVILTTSETEADISRAYEYHANSYLVKPLDFQRFNELMRTLGFYWLSLNKVP